MTHRKLEFTAALLALAVFALAILGCSGGRDDFFDTERLPFDRQAWDTGNERWAMSADLKRHHLPIGMTRDAVLELLGPATSSDARGLHYDVGMYWLDVLLDEHDRIAETILEMY